MQCVLHHSPLLGSCVTYDCKMTGAEHVAHSTHSNETAARLSPRKAMEKGQSRGLPSGGNGGGARGPGWDHAGTTVPGAVVGRGHMNENITGVTLALPRRPGRPRRSSPAPASLCVSIRAHLCG